MKNTLPSWNQLVHHTAASCWGGQRGLFTGALVALLALSGNSAEAGVIINVGVGTSHPTIESALAQIPAVLDQPYELYLQDETYAEDVVLNKTGSALNTLTIRPSAGKNVVILGTFTFGAGSAYATLSGDNGVAAVRALTLREVSASEPTMVFSGDAAHNTVTNVAVFGANALPTSGVIVIGNGTSTGNDHNTVTQSYVANASADAVPTNMVYAANAGGGLNDAFTFTQNQLFNFTGTGVLVTAGNGNAWNISGNSFYYNLASVPTTAQAGIDFRPGAAANDVTVANNFIGGRPGEPSGTIWTNASPETFRGIRINCGSSTEFTNEVNGNTVTSVSMTGAGAASIIALEIVAGRILVNNNVITSLANLGTGGVYNLVSRATTILSSFATSNGQVMEVAGGLTEVQGDLTNAGILNHTGGDILITRHLLNSGSFVQTSGDTEIKGDMLNGGLFTCSTGKVKLTGNGPQKVSGGNYFNLEVNGAGTKTFNRDAEVYNGVQMLNGILATGRYALTLAPLANLNETETSYVLGQVDVVRTPVAGATEDFGGVGLLMHPAANSSSPGETFVTRFTGIAPTIVAGRQGILRYFDIEAGSTALLNVDLTFKYFNHELRGLEVNNLRFFKSIDGGTVWQSQGVSGAGPGYAVLNAVTDLSNRAQENSVARWALAEIINPLPVGLTAFRAERQSRNAVLTWATASEQDNRGFGVEVSADGKAFREIGFVVAAGNGTSSAVRNYRFVDAAAGKTGTRYYRLRQTDLDGKTAYYGPQQLSFDATPASFAAYPTQFGAELTVLLTSPITDTATLRLLDGMGREVWHQEVPSGSAPLQVRPACAAGSYILTATVNGQVLRQRVVKE
ncbi:hypothetical protein I2I05_00215 [Hymenobacter sp. BT683]|uniref:T9SS type A sorting domain-containing protein n=1 Tax=Hymenobacter jeongseonensis TaxID=2791027 RepID=A0ABS0IBR6_9BACT|nr:hypothetical protein [Hymenobacter jeongseonensis]MBF9235807.1 hypothetical protein [Hymenobacter jeongseonensis]